MRRARDLRKVDDSQGYPIHARKDSAGATHIKFCVCRRKSRLDDKQNPDPLDDPVRPECWPAKQWL